ncbi:hypothetical protein CWS43_26855 [Rahnella sp. AA]|uniref:hypothetical protein n=1 Tax=Rahnella sp. AA TaxID=2057180 RepID=UPI000C323963|nr:hypothetical protein [Rahnella sp. AA]PKE27466.1 hypothetical protein CWS43_26855 [Rahnella sp. AA]
MKLTSETRETLQHYKSLINASRREAGLSPLNTTQILDDICTYLKYQNAVYIGGAYIAQAGVKKLDK